MLNIPLATILAKQHRNDALKHSSGRVTGRCTTKVQPLSTPSQVWRQSITASAINEVSCQTHVPATLPLVINPPINPRGR